MNKLLVPSSTGWIEILSETAEHCSSTCVILNGVAKRNGKGIIPGEQLIIKLMKHKDQFEREIEGREGMPPLPTPWWPPRPNRRLGSDTVMGILTKSDDEPQWAAHATKRGYKDYPHGLVMKAAQRNMLVILVRCLLESTAFPSGVNQISLPFRRFKKGSLSQRSPR